MILAVGPLTAYGAQEDLFASINGGNVGSAVFRYTPTGLQSTFAFGLPFARGLAFDSVGNLFVATDFCSDTCQSSILKITPNGTQTTFATLSVNFFASGVVIDSADNIFVDAQDGNEPQNLPSTIFKFAPDGTQSTFGSVPGQSFGPAFDSAGNLYVPDGVFHTIYKFTPDGTRSVFVGPSAFTANQSPAGLAFDRSGNLFVSTEGAFGIPPGDMILKFTPQGAESTFATGLNTPRGIVFDTTGNLFVAEIAVPPPGDILKFTPGGRKSVFASGFNQSNRGPQFLAIQPPTPTSVTINFDAIDASSNPVGGATLKDYLKQYGVNINKVTANSQVIVDDDRRSYGGGVVFASSPHNFLSNYGLNAPNSFTLNFATSLDSIQFTRIAGGPYPTRYASWTATAFNASDAVLSSVSESSPGIVNFPAKTFTLNGPRIVAVRFDSNGFGSAAFSAVLLDDLVLNYSK